MPQKDEAKSLFRLIVKFTVLALLAMIAILALAAILVSSGIVPAEQSIILVLIAEAAGAFLGGMFAAKQAPSHKLPVSTVTGLLIFLVLLIAGFLFSFPPSRHALLVLLTAVFPALFGGIFSKRQKRKPRH
ncbi:MAG: TIGR04086 family membrane protein [Oscillospiraceae bacterium]|jgi:putative membrane protein (TIGR04086 family)|nr:TIGR04086 family membrane protein [Oscillospiraceae bacterium]